MPTIAYAVILAAVIAMATACTKRPETEQARPESHQVIESADPVPAPAIEPAEPMRAAIDESPAALPATSSTVVTAVDAPSAERFDALVDAEVERVGRWLTGDFGGAAPGVTGNEAAVSRHAVRIWTARTDGFWILVETLSPAGDSTALEEQVIRVTRRGDGAVVARSFRWEQGAGAAAGAPPEYSPTLLAEIAGCDVAFWRTTDELYDGSTEGKGCDASDQGFGVLEVEVTPQRISRWYRQLDHTYREIRGAAREEMVLHRRDAATRP